MKFLKENTKWILVIALILSTGLIWHAVLARESGDTLTVAFLDVGQGDAIFIEAPNGNQILIDGGPNTKVLRELSKLMPFYDRSIDVIIATHPDADHIGGLIDVFERFEVDTFIEPGVEHDSGIYTSLLKSVEAEGSEYVLARRGTNIVLEDSIVLEVFFPDRDVSGFDTNDASIIAQLTYGEHEFLLTGDASVKIEEYIVSLEGAGLESDVLKVGHHGSNTSTSELFVGFVSPEYAIISAGKDNRYGHPHGEVLEKLAQFEVHVLATSEQGTIVFESDGENLVLH